MDALKNAWYPAAWSKDVGTQLLKRTLLNESIVFFRIRDGAPVALANTCPHRFAPLHLGKLIDDTLQCGYHGLRFNAAGKCVFNPDGDGITPPAAKVRSYPLHERYGLLWIWMGDPALADPTILPSYPFMESPDRYRPVTGYLQPDSRYATM